MVETGAAVNVIDELTYNSLYNKPDLLHLNKPYYGFGNPNKALEVIGFCVTTVTLREKSGRAAFKVIKERHQNLIGRKSARAIGMVTFNLDAEPENEPNVNLVATKTELSKEELASMYPQLFSGKLGCI